jgi:hypothetical protein
MTSKTTGVVHEVRACTDGYEIVVAIAKDPDHVVAVLANYDDARRFRVGDEVAIVLRKVPKAQTQA